MKEKKIFTLEEMIRKMTGLTAERLLVANKGLLKDGYDADVLIFDYDGLKVNATYTALHQKTDGISEVIVGVKQFTRTWNLFRKSYQKGKKCVLQVCNTHFLVKHLYSALQRDFVQ